MKIISRKHRLNTIVALISISAMNTSCSTSGSQGTKGPKGSYSGIGAESVSPEVIAKFAPTPISQEMSRKIQNYLDIRAPGAGMLHPNHKEMFFTWKVTGTNQVWKVAGPQTFPIQMTGGEDQTQLKGITNDGKYVILSRDRNGEENPGIYLQSVDGGELKLVQHQPKVQTFYGVQSQDGKNLYFRANDKDPKSYALYRYNIEKGEKELLFSEPGYWEIADIKNDSKLLLIKVFSNVKTEVYEFDMTSKKLAPLFGQKEDAEFQAVYGAKDNEYFVQTPRGSDFRTLYHVVGDRWTQVSPKIKFDVSSTSIDESRSKVFFTVNEAGYTKLHVLDVKSLREFTLPQFPDADHVDIGWVAKDGSLATLAVVNSKSPRTNYVWNLKTNKLTQWVISSSPEVKTDHFAKTSLEYYKTRDGVEIPFFVRRPDHCGKGHESHCAVVVHFHGGPESQATPGFQVTGQLVVEAGFIYVEPNVRGSDGYGQAWLNSDNGPKRLKVVTDIEDASKYFREKWGVKKVGVMGGSYGGYSTLYAMTKFAGSYDVGVEVVGMSNLMTFLMNTAPYRRALRIPEYGDPEKDKEALIELSPITHLEKLKAPLMLIQGANDPRVPVGEALQFNEAMEKKNIPHELVIFADEGHGAAKRGNLVIQTGKIIEFFKKYLK